jgi:uncharacterized protein
VPDREPELLMVQMSDGAKLAVHRYPARTRPAPAVLSITPYRKERALVHGWEYPDHGYDLYVADARGFGGSVARYEGLLSEREIRDGVELIEWIAARPSCTGRVGLVGQSYVGAGQMLIAARRPRGLVCITPMVGPVDTYRDWTYRGGIVSFVTWGKNYMFSGQPATVRDGLAHYYTEIMPDCFDNAAHRARSPEYVLHSIDVPALVIGGWYDYFLRGTMRSYLKIPTPKRLVIGPWGHVGFDMKQEDDLHLWFEHWLLGRGPDPTGTVRLFRTGSDEWVQRDRWFDLATLPIHDWHPLSSPAALTIVPSIMAMMAPPAEIRVEYPWESGFSHWRTAWSVDAPPFAASADIDGPIALEAVLDAGACRDFEIHVRLSAVQADGRVLHLSEGRLRAAHRAIDPAGSYFDRDGFPIIPWHPHESAEPTRRGEPTSVVVTINPICHRFAAGDRLRLSLTVTRADDTALPAAARLLPATRLRLPLTAGRWPAH